MDAIKEKIFNCGITPVVVIENAADAVPAANALLAGGINVIEITMRTDAGLQAIKNIARDCPDTLVIAGTVLTLEKCKECIAAGVKGIVSPGFDDAIVGHCVDNNILVVARLRHAHRDPARYVLRPGCPQVLPRQRVRRRGRAQIAGRAFHQPEVHPHRRL